MKNRFLYVITLSLTASLVGSNTPCAPQSLLSLMRANRSLSTQQKKSVQQKNKRLWKAIQNNNGEMVKELLDAGADPYAKEEFGRTSLMLAASNGCVKAARALLEAGVDIDTRDYFES